MAVLMKDVQIPKSSPTELSLLKHREYLASYGTKKDDYEYCITEHLRMSGIYWGMTAMDLMGALDSFNKADIIDFVKQCQYSCGGFGASVHHDPHLLYTLSAVQVRGRFLEELTSIYSYQNPLDLPCRLQHTSFYSVNASSVNAALLQSRNP